MNLLFYIILGMAFLPFVLGLKLVIEKENIQLDFTKIRTKCKKEITCFNLKLQDFTN